MTGCPIPPFSVRARSGRRAVRRVPDYVVTVLPRRGRQAQDRGRQPGRRQPVLPHHRPTRARSGPELRAACGSSGNL